MWGFLVFLIGLAYGWMSPGRQDKSQLFMRGLLIGVVIAIVLAVLGFFFGSNPVTGTGDVSFFGIVWTTIVLSLAFIVGVWLGDMIEGRRSRVGGVRRV